MTTVRGDSADTWRERLAGLRAEMQALAGELEQLRQTALQSAHEARETIVVGAVALDESQHELRVAGQAVHITHGEFRLLNHLLRQPGHVFSREFLLRAICGLDNPEQSRNVDAHVHRLRHKLGPAAACLEVVHGVGYRWNSGAEASESHPYQQESLACQ